MSQQPMFLARFHILQDEILPQRKLKLPEQQQYLWKRFLALLPDMLLLDCRLPSCSIQVAVLPFMWGTRSFLRLSLTDPSPASHTRHCRKQFRVIIPKEPHVIIE